MRSDADALHRQIRLITLALVSGVVIFGVVVGGIVQSGGMAPTLDPRPALRLGAVVLGIGLIGSAQVVGPLIADSKAGGVDPARSLWSGTIVSMALREAAGMIGGVLGLLTGDVLVMGALMVAAVVTMLVGVPGRDEIERRLR